MARPTGVSKNDGVARSHWGEAYDEIPKSVFAAIAWHLANLASGECDTPGAAEARFLAEWQAVETLGVSAPTARARNALAKKGA